MENKMDRKQMWRIANGSVWVLLMVVLVVCVVVEWYRQGCGVGSMVAAIVLYVGLCVGFWFMADRAIQGK